LVVLEGLKGKPVAEIRTEHQISQSQYYQWRDQFLAHAGQAFDVHQHTKREARLEQENARLKKLVGELTLELKKSYKSPRQFERDYSNSPSPPFLAA
jgi:transposase-like protein